MRMSITILTAFVLLLIALPCFAHNEIDQISSYYWSGYKNIEFNGDTLYLGTLNGNGVERYLIDSLGALHYLDRENTCGYDLIDFNRHVMVKILEDSILLADFSNFPDVEIRSRIALVSPLKYHGINFGGSNLFIAGNDDSLRIFNISSLYSPLLINTIFFPYSVIIGTTIALSTHYSYLTCYSDIYNISDPTNIRFTRTDTTIFSTALGNIYVGPAVGDTIAQYTSRAMIIRNGIYYIQYDTLGNRIDLFGMENQGDVGYYNSKYSFLASLNDVMSIFAFDGFSYKGWYRFDNINYTTISAFELVNNYFVICDPVTLGSLYTANPDSQFHHVFIQDIPYYGILSSQIYMDSNYQTKYLLCGISSPNSLRAYRFNAQGNPVEAGWTDSIAPVRIYIKGRTAICASSGKLAAVDLTNIRNNTTIPVLHTLSGFPNPLIDFDCRDSIIYAISDRKYYVIKYTNQTGFSILGSIDFPTNNLTSLIGLEYSSYVLKGNVGIVDHIDAYPLEQPLIDNEYRLPNPTYKNISTLSSRGSSIWASGDYGTDVVTGNIQLAHFGPEYISTGNQLTLSHDTLFVADGAAGFKVFQLQTYPEYVLTPLGQYATRNNITHVAINGNDFYTADYYSLQHLRWGAPIGIDDDTPILPQSLDLSQNYPNPFNGITTIKYSLNRQSNAKIDIYDILGRRVANLLDCIKPAGNHAAVWDAAALPSGIYFCSLKTDNDRVTKKMILLK